MRSGRLSGNCSWCVLIIAQPEPPDTQNYLPLPTQPRLTTLSRKRKEYSQLVDQYFGRGLASLDQQVGVDYCSCVLGLTFRYGIRSR